MFFFTFDSSIDARAHRKNLYRRSFLGGSKLSRGLNGIQIILRHDIASMAEIKSTVIASTKIFAIRQNLNCNYNTHVPS